MIHKYIPTELGFAEACEECGALRVTRENGERVYANWGDGAPLTKEPSCIGIV